MAVRTGLEPATPGVTGRYSNQLNYRTTEFLVSYVATTTQNANFKPGSVLLSHGEAPHYHRRYGVSLLSSAWGQVGPPRYRRQAYSVLLRPLRRSLPQPPEPISEQAEIHLSSVF